MQRHIALIFGGALAITLTLPATTARSDEGPTTASERDSLSSAAAPAAKPRAAKPAGVNPYLALVPNPSAVDYAGWRRYLQDRGAAKDAQRERLQSGRVVQPILVDEDEPVDGHGYNDSVRSGQQIAGFGSRSSQNHRARILGTLSPELVDPAPVSRNTEDDGAIPRARDTLVGSSRNAVATSGQIGDGPHGATTGDFDFYKVRGIAGKQITADIDTPSGPLDSVVRIYDSRGNEVAINDDDEDVDSLATYRVPRNGAYFVSVTGFATEQGDPFDPSSGDGADSLGPYRITVSQAEMDLDFYGVRLRKGDVLGASVEGGGTQLTMNESSGVNVHGSTQDATYIYPADTPLPGGGNAVTEHVADRAGWHYVAVEAGEGDYDVTVEVYRPGLERAKPQQTVFLDFDGARVNTNIWGGPGVRTLSPLKAFLGRWKLANSQYNALVNVIVKEVTENLKSDLKARGGNDQFTLRVLNSRDHADPWGKPNVSRVIVGGTVSQSGVDTIGISQSIDPGNFATEESALLLLDILSDPAGEPGDPSLNTYIPSIEPPGGLHRTGRRERPFTRGGPLLRRLARRPVQRSAEPDGPRRQLPGPLRCRTGPHRGHTTTTMSTSARTSSTPSEGFTGTEDTLTRLSTVLTQ